MFKYQTLVLAILSVNAYASNNVEQYTTKNESQQNVLPTIYVHPLNTTQDGMVSPVAILNSSELAQGDDLLGGALANELGVREDSFGGGASRPIIRGHNAPRVQIMQGGVGILDTSNLSPDHAVTVDPILAQRIEVIKGAATVLYGGGSMGGVVNVEDGLLLDTIPTEFSGKFGIRAGTNDHEKTTWAKLSVPLNDQWAVTLQGMYKDADDFEAITSQTQAHDDHETEEEHTETQQIGNVSGGYTKQKVDGTFSEQSNVGLGIAWQGEQFSMAMSHKQREDQYGIPGHSHLYAECHPHGVVLHCGTHETVPDEEHEHEASHGEVPEIQLTSKRTDVMAKWDTSNDLIDWVRVKGVYTDYQHHELDEGNIKTTFNTHGYDVRTDIKHASLGRFNGMVGISYSDKSLSALGSEAYLPKNSQQNVGIYLLEHANITDRVNVEVGVRYDEQQLDADAIGRNNAFNVKHNAVSASSSVIWAFAPSYSLGVSYSCTARLPTVQELGSLGVHLATNTYELGQPNLNHERANNTELSLKRNDDRWGFEFNLYQNRIANYIYAHALDQEEDFRLVRYEGRDATFEGYEAQVSYEFPTLTQVTLSSDAVRATFDDDHSFIPRIPADRTALTVSQKMGAVNAKIQWQHVERQSRVATDEQTTAGYNLVNLSANYAVKLKSDQRMNAFVSINNLFNEDYFQHASFQANQPQPSRKLMAGFVLDF